MPFYIVRNDIAQMHVDAIVNTANPEPVVGAGVDFRIHQCAGERLIKARRKIGKIDIGQAAVTPGFGLPCRRVIHTVGPVWQGGCNQEQEKLKMCYSSALSLALKEKCKSVAFPLISSGNYGFPKNLALEIAIGAFGEFLQENDMDIYLVVYDKESYALSETLFHAVANYIDERYIAEQQKKDIECFFACAYSSIRNDDYAEYAPSQPCARPAARAIRSQVQGKAELQEMLRRADCGFSERLLQLIDQTGKKDSEVYKKANIDRKLFSKIRTNKSYQPKKTTAVALAMALELDLLQTNDLLNRAGYALGHSSKFDIIVEYFILQKNYNIFEINAVLFEFDQPLLCGT